jgi:TPR repeat protein
MESWWHWSVELIAAGSRAEAIKVTRAAAEAGSLGASVRLARFGEEAGMTQEAADILIESAVRDARDDDETVHWNLYSASEALLGACDPEEKYHRIQRHLEKYAQASGDARAVLAVARRYVNGTPVAAPDELAAVDWYYCAIALGSKEAKLELKRLLGDA